MGKKLGQHFLHSATVLDGIMAGAHPRPGESVLETGPGKGALTERLLEAGARVSAVELDAGLCLGLRGRWAEHKAFRLIEGDILKVDLAPSALFGTEGPYAVIANLPYQISTPFLFRMIAHRTYCTRMVLMVQKEVAGRLVATPEDGKVYGSLSVAAHHAFQMKYLFTVPPGAFRPPPKVESAVVAFTPRPKLLQAEEETAFFNYVKLAFTTRRKMMWKPLARQYPHLSEAQGQAVRELVANRRAETLSPQEHLQVFRLLHNTAG
jgi:16S rRNA (adenine1518-N6/adenine1519-N6)-dimethyltransferase